MLDVGRAPARGPPPAPMSQRRRICRPSVRRCRAPRSSPRARLLPLSACKSAGRRARAPHAAPGRAAARRRAGCLDRPEPDPGPDPSPDPSPNHNPSPRQRPSLRGFTSGVNVRRVRHGRPGRRFDRPHPHPLLSATRRRRAATGGCNAALPTRPVPVPHLAAFPSIACLAPRCALPGRGGRTGRGPPATRAEHQYRLVSSAVVRKLGGRLDTVVRHPRSPPFCTASLLRRLPCSQTRKPIQDGCMYGSRRCSAAGAERAVEALRLGRARSARHAVGGSPHRRIARRRSARPHSR